MFSIVREILSGLHDLKDGMRYTIFSVVVGWLWVGIICPVIHSFVYIFGIAEYPGYIFGIAEYILCPIRVDVPNWMRVRTNVFNPIDPERIQVYNQLAMNRLYRYLKT